MANLNSVVLCGNLTKDVNAKFLPSGQCVANMRMAINRRYKKNEQWVDEATYCGIVAWGKTAESAFEFLKKGSAILVEGRLQSREWETDKGEKRSILEICAERVQFLDKKPEAKPEPDIQF